MPAGVPARGRGTQLDLDKSQRGVDLATTPLVNTGVPMVDSFTSPVGLAGLGLGVAGVARAGLAGGGVAAAKAAIAQAAPVVKYEIIKTAFEKAGFPSEIAIPAAMAVSGYKRGAKTAVAEEATVATRGAPSAGPVETPPVAPASPASATARISAPSPTGESPPSGPMNQLPDQKALNEAALAARRQAYQERLAAAKAKAAEAPAKFRLQGAEVQEYSRLRNAGKSHAEAVQLIEGQRALIDQLGLSTPTAAETRFPKGMRGRTTPE